MKYAFPLGHFQSAAAFCELELLGLMQSKKSMSCLFWNKAAFHSATEFLFERILRFEQ